MSTDITDSDEIRITDGVRERRALSPEDAEIRVREADDGTPRLTGYAAVFESRSVPLPGFGGEFVEEIQPGAFDRVMEDPARDVVASRNHDPDNLLGRESNGTLKLEVDARGLRYDVALPDTSVGRDTEQLVKRGDIHGSSFIFTVDEDDQEVVREEGRTVRRIHMFRSIHDVGPVTSPAYQQTVVSARSVKAARDLDAAKQRGSQAGDDEVVRVDGKNRMRTTQDTDCIHCGERLAKESRGEAFGNRLNELMDEIVADNDDLTKEDLATEMGAAAVCEGDSGISASTVSAIVVEQSINCPPRCRVEGLVAVLREHGADITVDEAIGLLEQDGCDVEEDLGPENARAISRRLRRRVVMRDRGIASSR